MVDEALEASRDGSIFSRVARDLTGGEEDAQVPPRVTYSTTAVRDLVKRVREQAEPPRARRGGGLPLAREGEGAEGAPRQGGVARAAHRAGADRARRGAARAGRRCGSSSRRSPRPSSPRSTRWCWWPTATTSSSASTGTCRCRRSTPSPWARVGFDTPAGLYHIQNKAVDPAWHVPNSDWAGDLAGTIVPGGIRGEPAEGALDGDLRRRRHPRHRPDLLARLGRLARLHPHGDPGRDRALRPGTGRSSRSTSRSARGAGRGPARSDAFS